MIEILSVSFKGVPVRADGVLRLGCLACASGRASEDSAEAVEPSGSRAAAVEATFGVRAGPPRPSCGLDRIRRRPEAPSHFKHIL